MNYSSVFIVYMAVFESPSILLFNEKVVSHWLLFYARKSFHLPSLIAVEFTKFSCYCANILSTHLLYLSSRACKCMLIFQPGGVLCWLKDAKCHRQLSTLDLLWPALSPDPQRNLVSSFQMQIFFYPFLCWLWINADHLHSWTAGQATPAVYVFCRPFTCTQLCCWLIHTALSGGGTKTFPHYKLGRNVKGTWQLSGLQTSWLHLMHTWRGQGHALAVKHMNHLATLPHLLPNHPSSLETLRLCILLCQAHRTPWVSHQSANQVSILRGSCGCWVTSYSSESVVRPPLSPLWHWQWYV